MAISRSEIAARVRPLYGIAGDDATVPNMDSDAEVLTVANQIVSGEAARIAAGGTALVDISAAKVAAKLAVFNPLQQSQAQKMQAFTKEEKDLFLLFPNTVKLIMRLFDELEFNNPDMTSAEKRNLCRAWGLPYINEPGEVYQAEWTVPAQGFVVVDDIQLADANQITLTVVSGDEIKACRIPSGCSEGMPVAPGTPVNTTKSLLPGLGNNLVMTSGSAAPTVTRVKIVG